MRPPPLPKFKCRVLIVDDVEDTGEMYALYFTYLGWEVGQHLKRDGVKTVAANPPHRLKEASRSRSEEFVPAEQIDFAHFEAPNPNPKMLSV